MLIGIIGDMGCGKDEAYKQISKRTDAVRLAFADRLKEVVAKAWKIPAKDMKAKPKYVRSLLQIAGTDLVRNQIDNKYWVRYLRNKITQDKKLKKRLESSTKHIIITDVRFKNEAAMIRREGGRIIRIVRGKKNKVRGKATSKQKVHESEMDLKNYIPDYVVFNDGTKKNLGDDLANVLDGITPRTYRR